MKTLIFITAEVAMNPLAQLIVRSSCGSWVMLHIVLKTKVLHKTTPFLRTTVHYYIV